MRVRILSATLLLLAACRPDPVPKPKGYFRIDLGEREYQKWDGAGAFSSEIAANANMELRLEEGGQRWYDLVYARHRARVHLTHRFVEGRLWELIEDAHTFKAKHEQKAARIKSHRINRAEAQVHGTLFYVDGDVASPLVFYLTDSTRHFLYGALYFDARPNGDSLAPVTERIREDVRHFAEHLHWH
jgi:gliding motility-associated lipoprotein GldD